MSLTPCLRCGELTRDGSYCRTHDPRRKHGRRGSGGKQATFRRRTLKRTGGRCSRCGSRHQVEAHHPVGLAAGGTHKQEGVPLCVICHRALHGAY